VVVLTLKDYATGSDEPIEVGSKKAHEIAALIDDIGAMLPEVESKQKMIKAYQKELQAYTEKMKALMALVSAIASYGPDETFELHGDAFTAAVGKRYVVRMVTNPQLAIKLLNKAKKGIAWQVVTVPLGKLDAYLTPEDKAQVIKVDRGERPLVVVNKANGQGA
jgi:hypothetical protein